MSEKTQTEIHIKYWKAWPFFIWLNSFKHKTNLLGQLGLHFFLESPEQEGAEHFVQTTDDQNGLFFIQVHL